MADVAEEDPEAAKFAEQLAATEDEQVAEYALSYWNAWHSLTSDRPMGAMGGAGRIPWSVIDRYAERNHFEDVDLLARMLWAMDDVFLAHIAEQSKRRNAASGT